MVWGAEVKTLRLPDSLLLILRDGLEEVLLDYDRHIVDRHFREEQ